MKYRYLLLVNVFFLFWSCGKNNPTNTNDQQFPENSLISRFEIDNSSNLFSLTTKDSTYVFVSYSDLYANENYMAYSAGEKSLNHEFKLFFDQTRTYKINLRVETERSYKETLFTYNALASGNDFLKVSFVDVEQGDGNLIETPFGDNIVFDGGFGTHEPSWGAEGGADEGDWDGNGEPLMLNYLREEGITHVRYLIASHNHGDHTGGVRDIRDSEITYGEYITRFDEDEYPDGTILDVYNPENNLKFQFLNIGLPPGAEDTENNYSIVLKVCYKEAEFLFAADAEADVEHYMIDHAINLSADVLEVGHHGSHTSSSPEFLSAVFNQYCRIAGISFGTNNPYGHPHNLDRFSNYEVFGTNIPSSNYLGQNYHFNQGTIKFYSDGNIIIVNYK